MSNTAYIGSGTTLSSKYYLRSFYRSNREAGTSSKRREFSGNQLALADGRALRQAVRRLTSSDFSDDQDANTRNSVLAYIQTYNNMLSSAGSSSDRTLERSAKQLKNITSEYSSELDKIGITVNDDGTLTSRTTLFESADLSKFKELFSADAAYMQRTSTYAKRFASRGEALVTSDNNLLMQKIRDCGGVDFDLPVLLGYTGLSDALLRKYMEDSRAVWEGHADALPQVQVGSVIGTHGGPGAVVAAFFRKGSRA